MKIYKIIPLPLMIFWGMTCLGQDQQQGSKFTLKGETADKRLDSVSLEYITNQGKYIHEVVAAPGGDFVISGPIDQPSFAFLLFRHKGEVISKRDVELKRNLIYLEPRSLLIISEGDEQHTLTVQGSKTQDEWNDLKRKAYPVQVKIDSLTALNEGAAHGESKLSSAQKLRMAALQRQVNQIYYSFFMEHPNSYVSADRAMYLTTAYGLDSLKKIYQNFGPGVKESMGAKRLAAVIKSREVGLQGTTAFPFTIDDKEGHPLSLASFKGKYVILDFWATWCIPCRNAMPHMVSLYQKYKNKNVVFIAIGDDDRNVANWAAAIQKDGTGMFHHALRGVNAELTRKGTPNPRDMDEQYGVRALPTQFLIDPQGKIIGRFEGSGNPDDDIEKLLASIIK